MLRERDVPGGANIGLISPVARHALDSGFRVVVEGILAAERYGPMPADLVAGHRGAQPPVLPGRRLRGDGAPPRHPAAGGRVRPGTWPAGTERDLLPGGVERVVPQAGALDGTPARILADTALTPPGWTPRP
ncbi:hypothetical protein ACIRVF_32150 [Kitasatospora sp. NPDC101157]|uniref:hypothetical protein n=1 Tax=Kitasatospora sp. NPDC101157 TaxID=3364098 RepID=UPI0037FB3CC8